MQNTFPMNTLKIYPALFIISLIVTACGVIDSSGGGVNFFSIEQDIELGKQVQQQIASDPQKFPILPERGNEEVYKYVRGITQKILNSGKVAYAKEFPWTVTIIKDDKTLNAFATPGGFIYVYTGLIKFLDSEHQLAGVLGHEIAHSAQRHSTRQMTKAYGASALVSVITGKSDPGQLEQIALAILNLKFSRGHETEADSYSVNYLCGTHYRADGAAGFFQKIESQSGKVPEFLSTHPDPGNRVENIKRKALEMECRGNATNESNYSRIKRMLD